MTARVLIVDHVLANARLLEARLAAEYYQVACVDSGAEALRLACEWRPDIVLLDVMMPGMDGFNVCRRLKTDATASHIPVVMLTALDKVSERVRGLEAGADDFVSKPVEFDTLLVRVRGLVRLKRLLDESRARGVTARTLGIGGDGAAAPAIAGTRSLIVNDRGEEARRLQEWLASDGVLAGLAESEAEMHSLSAAIDFDLIVLSLTLANGDPLALVSRLRAGEKTQEIPLLLIADADGRERILRGFDLGANDWVVRPVDENELRARARNQIRRKLYQQRLRADLDEALGMALIDPLTGLFNQRYVMHHLRSLLASAEGGELAVLMIDIDHFKRINDSYGHPVGDRALTAVTETLRSNVRVFDTLARYGGEEFIVVMPGASISEATGAGERLRDAVAQMRFLPDGQSPSHRLTVSIGVAASEDAGQTAEALLQAADAALEGAKREGRNRVELARPDY